MYHRRVARVRAGWPMFEANAEGLGCEDIEHRKGLESKSTHRVRRKLHDRNLFKL